MEISLLVSTLSNKRSIYIKQPDITCDSNVSGHQNDFTEMQVLHINNVLSTFRLNSLSILQQKLISKAIHSSIIVVEGAFFHSEKNFNLGTELKKNSVKALLLRHQLLCGKTSQDVNLVFDTTGLIIHDRCKYFPQSTR